MPGPRSTRLLFTDSLPSVVHPPRSVPYTNPLSSQMKERLEYWLVLAVAHTLGWLPRSLSRLLVRVLTWSCYLGLARLRGVGERNLRLALPELSSKSRQKILRRVFRNLGWQMV